MVELAGLLELLPGELDPLVDLAGALRRALAQAPLELVDAGGDEDRHRARHLVLDAERSLGLELEQRNVAVRRDPVELRAERAVAVAGDVLDVLEELAARDACEEVVVGEEPVLAAVLLPGRRSRVVAETVASIAGTRATSSRISVPLPAPDGPVTTSTVGIRGASTTCY